MQARQFPMTVNSTGPPEITLREPIDQEFLINRKMAHKFYQSELHNKMEENRMKVNEDLEKRKKDIDKKRNERVAKHEEYFKKEYKVL